MTDAEHDDEEAYLLHRDDLHMDDVAEIEKMFAELYPGCTVSFAGDQPEISDELREQIAAWKQQDEERFCQGRCCDCGKQMSNWPENGQIPADWQPPADWAYFTEIGKDDVPAAWQCPECARDDQPRPL